MMTPEQKEAIVEAALRWRDSLSEKGFPINIDQTRNERTELIRRIDEARTPPESEEQDEAVFQCPGQ